MININEYPYADIIVGNLNYFWDDLDDLIKLAKDFIHVSGYEGSVECNDRIMLNVIMDFTSEVSKLKGVDLIADMPMEKNIAYKAACILRRKPLQFVRHTEDEKDIFVNERFAVFLVVNECMLTGGEVTMSKENRAKFEKYLDLLLNYFEHGEYNPQAIELAIESFKMGALVSQEVEMGRTEAVLRQNGIIK